MERGEVMWAGLVELKQGGLGWAVGAGQSGLGGGGG